MPHNIGGVNQRFGERLLLWRLRQQVPQVLLSV